MGEIDPAFIQATDQRPKLNPTNPVADEIPIIDLSVLSSPDETRKVVSEIGHACKNWDFSKL
ncbi:hypothetical protein Prudu_022015 [Prunus dulcis]|uniref:2-oxoglutarate and Fe(II)-dependent oxygenase superfamily protein n=1 Tax=Prunus dulcis TaxID=3755 RepID=A0A4Y1S0C1_PRUDU|nr:hypothetical protein Prudu_022015 [Prunus dulcis]